tara:strand:+ start:556 stop:738 length:183 start_codon:yes stop_codon:yes gene_type:complete
METKLIFRHEGKIVEIEVSSDILEYAKVKLVVDGLGRNVPVNRFIEAMEHLINSQSDDKS